MDMHRLMRHLVGLVSARRVMFEQRRIPLPAQFHEHLRRPVRCRALFLSRRVTVRPRLRPVLRGAPMLLLALPILLEDLDRNRLARDLDHFGKLDIVDRAQQRPFARHLPFRKVQVPHRARDPVRAVHARRRIRESLRQPGMFQALVHRDPPVHVHREHAIDQIERRVAHRVPVRRRVIESAHLDLLRQIVRILGRAEFVRERWEAAEADVEHHA